MTFLSDRHSIAPTYDSRQTGERFNVETREHGWREVKPMPDPFVNHTVHVRGWRNALRVLLRRHSLTVVVGADASMVEDVLELDNDYKGLAGSTRRQDWDAGLQQALEDFAP